MTNLCIRGHEMTGDNIYLRTDRSGARCRLCMNLSRLKRGDVIAGNKWTDDQIAKLYRLKGEGKSVLEIAALMGCNRSRINTRLHYDRMTPEQRAAKRERNTKWARNEGGLAPRQGQPYRFRVDVAASRPSDELIAERDRCLTQPRDLTAAFFGDPLPGRSALDRRQST
jgi:hypothetical protein